MSGPAVRPGDIPRLEDTFDKLWKGTSASAGADTEFAKSCKDKDGQIKGIGPKCTTDEEVGKKEYALCYYDHVFDCMTVYMHEWEPPCQRLVAAIASGGTCDPCLDRIRLAYEKMTKCIDGQDTRQGTTGGAAAKCECKNCLEKLLYGYCGAKPCPPPDDPTVDPPVDPNVETENPLTTKVFKTSSKYGIIPRVFGRYVTNGNIIWVGNRVDLDITYTKTLDGGHTEVIEDSVTKVDFLLGLSIGELSDLLRVWVDKRLVFNATLPLDEDGNVALNAFNTGATDIDLSSLADSDYEMARLLTFKPTISFLSGDAAQKVQQNYATDVGWGRCPAHRNIALVMFRDVDLRLFTNAFPEFEFDVISEPPQDILPKTESAVLTLDAGYLEVDQATGLVIVRDGDTLTYLNLNTFEEQYSTTITDLDSVMTMKSGHLFAADTNGDAFAVQPYKNIIRHAYGPTNAPSEFGTASFVAYTDIRIPFDVAFITSAGGGVYSYWFDYNLDIGYVGGTIAALPSYLIHDASITGIDGMLYYFQFLLPSGTQNDMKIRRYKITDLGLVVLEPPVLTTTTLLAATWGGATTGVTLDKVLRDPSDNGFVLLFSTGYIVKLDIDLAVVWTSQTTYMWPTFSKVGEARAGLASPLYYYVATTGELVSVALSDGTVTVVEDLNARGYALPAGAQYYDAKTASVIYVSDADTLVRVFPGRIIPDRMPISTIIDRLVEQVGVDASIIDTSGIADVSVDGYYIDAKTTVRDEIIKLGRLYQFTAVDNGRKLALVKESVTNTPIALDESDVLLDSVDVERVINEDFTDGVTLTFFNIDDTGLFEVTQSISLKPDDEKKPTVEEISIQVNDTPENVRPLLEQLLQMKIAARRTFVAALMPKYVRLTPRDRVSWNGVVYRLHNDLKGSGSESLVGGSWFDPDIVQFSAEIAPNQQYTDDHNARPTVRDPYRPIALFMNAVTDEDQSRCLRGSDLQVLYTGIDAPSRIGINPTQFGFRMYKRPADDIATADMFDLTGGTNGRIIFNPPQPIPDSPTYNTNMHTEGVHIGYLLQAPDDTTWQFKTDTTSSLIIKFDHEDTKDYFVTYANKYDVLESPRVNLLVVGREYIQFHGFVVDVDNRTVTFSTLYRGKFGTEPYMGTHEVGEHCFLYTPETFKVAECDPAFTKRRQTAKLFIRRSVFAGTPAVDWGLRADAGSARPYGPSPAIYRRNRTFADFNGHRRRSVQIDPMQGGGEMPSEWQFDSFGGQITIQTAQSTKPSIPEFEDQYLLSSDAAPETTTVFLDSDFYGQDFELPADDYITVVEINGDIWGHPTITRVPGSSGTSGGGGGCDAGGEGYDLGAVAGCIDGAGDFGGVFHGPNYLVSFALGLTAPQQACYDANTNFYADQYALGYDSGYVEAYFAGFCA